MFFYVAKIRQKQLEVILPKITKLTKRVLAELQSSCAKEFVLNSEFGTYWVHTCSLSSD